MDRERRKEALPIQSPEEGGVVKGGFTEEVTFNWDLESCVFLVPGTGCSPADQQCNK